jgi:Domain of unknown function DUF11
MLRLRTVASGLVVGAVVALAGGGAAVAAPVPRSDLGVSTGSVGGHIGEQVQARMVVRNNGPDPVLPGTWVLDIQAPAGTRITGGDAIAGTCNHMSDQHVLCRYGFGIRDGDKRELRVTLQIVDQPVGCGRATVGYANDPRPGNNAANIRVTVDGKPGNCLPVRNSPSPTPRASKSAKASATPTEELTLPPDDSPAASEGALPAYQSNSGDGSGGLSLASVLVIGGGVLLVVLGGLLIWRLLRKGSEDDYYDDDATGPIYS